MQKYVQTRPKGGGGGGGEQSVGGWGHTPLQRPLGKLDTV